MRNGNTRGKNCVVTREYGSYRTYEEWKHAVAKVSSVVFVSSYRTYEEWKHGHDWWNASTSTVLTVPMRNGNCLANCCTCVRSTPGSYRTYEELKLPVELWYVPANIGSYRTYTVYANQSPSFTKKFWSEIRGPDKEHSSVMACLP